MISGIDQFLDDYPLMVLRPSRAGQIIKGCFAFVAHHAAADSITDSFEIEISVSEKFPEEPPTVKETGGRIPRKPEFHVNSNGTLCLGSPLSVKLKLSQKPDLIGFTEYCLVPYLFAISHKLKTGDMPFGELAHGSEGAISDYIHLFKVKTPSQVFDILKILGSKKRLANKWPCPCGCRLRLGRCQFNFHIRKFRFVASRPWYRKQLLVLKVASQELKKEPSAYESLIRQKAA